MTKYQFLDKLRTALNGKVTPELLRENMRYYEDYINTEIRKGKSEEEVLGALGDPRLIARTIVETGGGSGAWSEEYTGGERQSEAGSGEEYEMYRQPGGRFSGMLLRLPLWVWILILLVIVVLILSVVFSVIAAILPVVLPILLVILAVKLFRDWVN